MRKRLEAIATCALLMCSGCGEFVPKVELEKEKLHHQREIVAAVETAKATTQQTSMAATTAAVEQAKRDAFAQGKADALKDIQTRLKAAFDDGQENGILIGESQSRDKFIEEGKVVGRAIAAAEEYKAGMEAGAIAGAFRGRVESQKEFDKKLAEEVAKAREEGIREGIQTGEKLGREHQRQESYGKVASVALSIASVFSAVLMFTYVSLSNRRTQAEKKQLQEDRQLGLENERRWFILFQQAFNDAPKRIEIVDTESTNQEAEE